MRSISRSRFDLSYTKTFTADFDLLYPVMHDEVVPSDFIKLGVNAVVRMQPMVSPCLTPIDVYAYYFFVPYRLLWDPWEEFITGGKDGDIGGKPGELPRFKGVKTNPTTDEQNKFKKKFGVSYPFNSYDVGSLWDYFGMPVRKAPLNDAAPLDFPWRAYSMVWSDYFRDENLTEPIDWYDDEYSHYLLPFAYKKDYFTSALPWQQRGTSPAVPLTGLASALWPNESFDHTGTGNYTLQGTRDVSSAPAGTTFKAISSTPEADTNLFKDWMNTNKIDLTRIGTFTVSDLRLMSSVQRMQELSARHGFRYIETIRSHFGYAPTDSRLQRAEYIGGFKMPVVVSDVLQTSESTTQSPQGTMTGYGLSVNGKYVGSYRVKEHGIILGLMAIRVRPSYQDGINRQWLRQTRYDFLWPSLVHLSEQAIYNSEIFAKDNDKDENLGVWGYQGRYDEMRRKYDLVCGQMRSYKNDQSDYGNGMTYPAGKIPASLDYWNLSRKFSARPGLNWDFVKSSVSKRIMAVQDEPSFIIQWHNSFKAIRPLPKYSIPGGLF